MALVVKTSSIFNVVLDFIIGVLYLFIGKLALLHSAIGQGTMRFYMGLATTLTIIPLLIINMYAHEIFNDSLVTITSVLLRTFGTIYGTYMAWTHAQHLLRMPGMKWIKKTVVSPAWAVFKFSTFDARTTVLIDSGCTKLVFHNSDKLINLRKPDHNYVMVAPVGWRKAASHSCR